MFRIIQLVNEVLVNEVVFDREGIIHLSIETRQGREGLCVLQGVRVHDAGGEVHADRTFRDPFKLTGIINRANNLLSNFHAYDGDGLENFKFSLAWASGYRKSRHTAYWPTRSKRNLTGVARQADASWGYPG